MTLLAATPAAAHTRCRSLPATLGRMKPSVIVMFAKLCAIVGTGVYFGAAVSGLITILSGSGRISLGGAVVLGLFGMLFNFAIAHFTSHWLLPHLSRRVLIFTAAGLVTLPLALSPHLPVFTFGLIVLGAVTTVTLHTRAVRAARAVQRPVRR